MKTIKILKVLINILYVILLLVIVLAIIFIVAVFFFNEHLPFFLQGYKMLFSSFFDWKLFLVPFSTVINYVLFVVAVYYLKKSIQPFIVSDFYSTIVIKNLKRAGGLFVFIGVSTIVFRLTAFIWLQNLMPAIEGYSYSWLKVIGALTSSIDITILFLIIIGLFFLLFSKAFANAKELKQENDLII